MRLSFCTTDTPDPLNAALRPAAGAAPPERFLYVTTHCVWCDRLADWHGELSDRCDVWTRADSPDGRGGHPCPHWDDTDEVLLRLSRGTRGRATVGVVDGWITGQVIIEGR